MSEQYCAKVEWAQIYQGAAMMYPAEYLIRIFMGKYPKLNLDRNTFKDKKLIDIGCGDGRHVLFAKTLGFETYGVEISEEIVQQARNNLSVTIAKDARISVGSNTSLPFEDRYFDYALSWNACYYVGLSRGFERVIVEFARILKSGGRLVLSIPKASCFIFDNSVEEPGGYRTIRGDYFNTRNGEVMRAFGSEQEIEGEFSSYFKNFIFGSIEDDCFGLRYDWHLVVCVRK